jgi:hypothetical protein
MSAVELVLAFEYRTVFWAVFLAIVLAVGFWVPYLYKEIRRGKAQVGPGTPVGAGNTHPGGLDNPAPGQPDARADPYEPRAQR